jgi:hypothetical protein
MIHNKLSRLMLTALALAPFTGHSSYASSVVAEWTQGVGVTGQTANSAITWGQTFQPAEDGYLDSISIYASASLVPDILPAPQELTFKFYDVTGPSGVALQASKIVSIAELAMLPDYSLISASFLDAHIELHASHTYAFSISYEHPNNELLFTQLAEAGYLGGTVSMFFDDLFFTPQSDLSLAFQVTAAPLIIDSDGDGIADDQDPCPQSDLSATVVIAGQDTGVPNNFVAPGCTIADEISDCAATAGNHGQFVSGVAHLANALANGGGISKSDKGALQSAAAHANVP